MSIIFVAHGQAASEMQDSIVFRFLRSRDFSVQQPIVVVNGKWKLKLPMNSCDSISAKAGEVVLRIAGRATTLSVNSGKLSSYLLWYRPGFLIFSGRYDIIALDKSEFYRIAAKQKRRAGLRPRESQRL
jgi:hypothetical protein